MPEPHAYDRAPYTQDCRVCGRDKYAAIHQGDPGGFGGVFSALLQGAIRLHEEYTTLVEAGYTKDQAISLQQAAITANIQAAAMMKIAGIDPETGERDR